MRIRYQFDIQKAIATMLAFLRRVGPMDKLKLIKLLYLADRDCFVRFGRPITGDKLVAMDHGPVPSSCLNLLNGELQSDIFVHLHLRDREVSLEESVPANQVGFDAVEEQVIEETHQRYGHMTTSQLYKLVHELPEYKRHYVQNTSREIGFDTILEFYGGEDQFRHNRPVITQEMRKHLSCPLPRD